jgi:hypothetical protein
VKNSKACIILCLTLIFLLSCPYEFEVHAEPWLSGWTYRKSHLVKAAAGSGAGYQINVTVHYGSGSDAPYNVYLNSKCRTDFEDIRWTDNDGITLLSYWIQSKTDGVSAFFWIKVADDLTTSDVTIYIYYGKAAATSSSNGENTFLQFDDFDNLDSWFLDASNASQTAVIEDGQAKLTHNVAVFCHLERSMIFDNIVVQAKLKREDTYEESIWGMGLGIYFDLYDFVGIKLSHLEGMPRRFRIFLDKNASLTTAYVGAYTWASDVYVWLRIRLSGTKVYFDYSNDGKAWTYIADYSREVSWATPSLTIIGHGHEYKVGNAENPDWDNNGTVGIPVNTYADDYIVRKFGSNVEPSQAAWGSQETNSDPQSESSRWIHIASPHIFAAIALWSLALMIGVGVVLAKGQDLSDLPFIIMIGIGIFICLFIALAVLSGFQNL